MIFKSFPKPGSPYEMRNFLISDETIVVHDRVGQVSYHRHTGPLSLKTVTRGEERYNVHGFSEFVRTGEVLVVNGGQPYQSAVDGESVESLSVFFSRTDIRDARQILLDDLDLLDDPLKLGPAMEFSATKQAASAELLSGLHDVLNARTAPRLEQHEASVRLLHGLLGAHFDRLSAAGCIGSSRPSARSELYRRCEIGRAFIQAHFAEDIALVTIAAAANLSRAHFLRAFSHFFGETPSKMVQRLRLEQAAQMLEAGEGDVSTVALAVGYANLSAFSRAFRVHHARRPSALMKRQSGRRRLQG